MTEPANPGSLQVDAVNSPEASQQTSYAAVVTKRPSLKKFDYEVSMIDGIPTIEVPEEVVNDSVPLWEDFLVGRFPNTAPHVAKIHVIVNKIWPLGDKSVRVDVFEINSKSVKFRIRDAATRARILRRGMWNIAGQPMIVAKWSPILEETLPEVKTMPLWVTVKNVPHSMYSWDGLGFLTSPVGHPIRLHPETEQCTDFEVAKVFVEVNLSQELPKTFRFKLGQDFETVEFVYPWLPPRCSRCSRWGHQEDVCVMKQSSPTKVQNVELEEGEVDLSHVEQHVQTELVDAVPVSNLVHEKEKQSEIQNPEVEVGETFTDEQGWSKVSPGKGCKSREKSPLAYGGVTILSPSRYSVLQEDQENSKEKESELVMPTEQENNGTTVLSDNLNKVVPEKQNPTRTTLPRSSKSAHKVLSENASQKAKDNILNTSNRRTSKKNH